MRKIQTLRDVVDWQLCIGCGACYYACDQGVISLENVEDAGIRPRFHGDGCGTCTRCLSFCPGNTVDGDLMTEGRPKTTEFDHEFGQTLEIWQGYASDPEIRHLASSGGLLSALSLYCLEKGGMNRVVHSGMDPEKPWLNKTQTSVNREDILSKTGSRYAPSSPCDSLDLIEKGEGLSVFIGKPCDAATVCQLATEKVELGEKLGVVLSFFCAGTPSTRATLDLLDSMDIPREEIDTLRYRGEGWPGGFKVRYRNREKEKFMTYKDSWGTINRYRPLRCTICPHGLGRVADLSCGDAWNDYDDTRQDEGQSIVLVRTERGRRILHGAIEAGYVTLSRITPQQVVDAQPLLQRRRDVFARILGMKLCLLPTPSFPNFSLLRSWKNLPLKRKLRITSGTVRRVLTRGLWKRKQYFTDPEDPSLMDPALRED
ncbi:MAG: Coenzyme F420 hydrogenase/dehydrogenase, beta subunit C-terminal domain [Candidatus Omnitrophica bacterium]|nr:Coenzyme F420 hydrogenase/dehydrogenase, beta subunit C-terminal domain [Candidatus Omnitrophota bacterium]MCA9416961.1 Coenzyme F420 hydrogenase/dehydrogenase, beta subunit C-terminal domain [Candidatus Omnitrophota bacterium]MCA9442770.1 Coenzyme F420 hydrogenase/dehydrogenase, beta subunit C-terminal domain [Candidatus Omnitrophota bacterium]